MYAIHYGYIIIYQRSFLALLDNVQYKPVKRREDRYIITAGTRHKTKKK
jgi:hypothetical protein